MRMWGINPKFLCRKHLLGEHVEMHMLVGSIQKNRSISGFISKGLVNPHEIKNRHDELVKEMINRGMNHKSPLDFDCSNYSIRPIDIQANIIELKTRCELCRERIEDIDNNN